jgi:hypothetical protein
MFSDRLSATGWGKKRRHARQELTSWHIELAQ